MYDPIWPWAQGEHHAIKQHVMQTCSVEFECSINFRLQKAFHFEIMGPALNIDIKDALFALSLSMWRGRWWLQRPLKNSHYISNLYFQDRLIGTYDSWVMKARPETKTGDIHCKSGKGKQNSKENIKPNKTLAVICTIRVRNHVPEHNIVTLNIN